MRMAVVLQEDGHLLESGWEDWTEQTYQQKHRTVPANELLMVVSARKIRERDEKEQEKEEQEDKEAAGGVQGAQDKERQERWKRFPREVRLAIKRLHVNLGHPSKERLLRALRIGKASAQARAAAQDFF